MIDRKFEFIIFDMIGTTIRDSYNGDSLIIDSFLKAFALNGIRVTYKEINKQRGIIKKEAINNILSGQKLKHDQGDKIYLDFIDVLNNFLTDMAEIEGASDVFRLLKDSGIKVGLGSGLPKDLMIRIIINAGWQPEEFNYIGSSEDFGRGRPDPAMIIYSMAKLKIENKSRVLKVGDTIADIQEGKNAGVLTAGVITGTQSREELRKYEPDYIFTDIRDIISLI